MAQKLVCFNEIELCAANGLGSVQLRTAEKNLVIIAIRARTRTEPTETRHHSFETETLKLRDTRLHKPKIRKYKNDSNTLEYGLY